jgi:hypothetical protein
MTSNYSATANLHNSQIITAPAKPFPACCAFTSHSLATASKSGNSSASRAQVLLYRNDLVVPLVFLITPRHGPHKKHPISKNNSIVARRFVAPGTCLPSRCPEMALEYPPMSRSLHTKGSIRYIINVPPSQTFIYFYINWDFYSFFSTFRQTPISYINQAISESFLASYATIQHYTLWSAYWQLSKRTYRGLRTQRNKGKVIPELN